MAYWAHPNQKKRRRIEGRYCWDHGAGIYYWHKHVRGDVIMILGRDYEGGISRRSAIRALCVRGNWGNRCSADNVRVNRPPFRHSRGVRKADSDGHVGRGPITAPYRSAGLLINTRSNCLTPELSALGSLACACVGATIWGLMAFCGGPHPEVSEGSFARCRSTYHDCHRTRNGAVGHSLARQAVERAARCTLLP